MSLHKRMRAHPTKVGYALIHHNGLQQYLLVFCREVHTHNLISALFSLASSSRTLARGFNQLQVDALLANIDSNDALESLAQLAEVRALSEQYFKSSCMR